MTTQKERWEQWTAPESLEDCVKMFFELVDKVEESNHGVEFKPNKMEIHSCRVWDTHCLNKIIPRMKQLAQHTNVNTGHLPSGGSGRELADK